MLERPVPSHYLTLSRDNLLAELAGVTGNICAAIEDLATAEAAELESRIDGWLNAEDKTVKGREWAATVAAAGVKQALIEKRADLAILNEVKWFILKVLDDGDSGRSTD